MRSVCGPVRLSQEIESSAAAFYPNCDPRSCKFRDRTMENQRYDYDIPTQSYLENFPPSPLVSPTFQTHNHCITSDYGSTANPTSTHLASSSNVSQWRSVARWETNGADLLPSVQRGENDQDYGRNAYELCRKLGCLDENAVLSMQLPFYRPEHFPSTLKESLRSATVSLSQTGMENGQIAP